MWSSEHRNLGLTPLSSQRHDIAKAWDIIKCFGYPKIQEELKGFHIHSLRNILTLEPTMHSLFGSLELWLVPTVSCEILLRS